MNTIAPVGVDGKPVSLWGAIFRCPLAPMAIASDNVAGNNWAFASGLRTVTSSHRKIAPQSDTGFSPRATAAKLCRIASQSTRICSARPEHRPAVHDHGSACIGSIKTAQSNGPMGGGQHTSLPPALTKMRHGHVSAPYARPSRSASAASVASSTSSNTLEKNSSVSSI